MAGPHQTSTFSPAKWEPTTASRGAAGLREMITKICRTLTCLSPHMESACLTVAFPAWK